MGGQSVFPLPMFRTCISIRRMKSRFCIRAASLAVVFVASCGGGGGADSGSRAGDGGIAGADGATPTPGGTAQDGAAGSGTSTGGDALAIADTSTANVTESGGLGTVDAGDNTATTTTGGIVSFTRGGQSLEVFAVPGQVILFLGANSISSDAQQLIEGQGGVRLDTGIDGNRYLVQVPVGSEGRYIATVTGDPRVLDASPNIISSDSSATVLEGDCKPPAPGPHALDVMAAYQAAFPASDPSNAVTCENEAAGYTNSYFLQTTTYYEEYGADSMIAQVLAAGSDPHYLNTSFGPNVQAIEEELQWVSYPSCFPAQAEPCKDRATAIATTGRQFAWTARLQVLANYCGKSAPNACNAVLAMSAGNDNLPLNTVLASVRTAGRLSSVLSSNATIVAPAYFEDPNYVQPSRLNGTDPDFIISDNTYAVIGGPNLKEPGSSFASPFVLGLTFRKAAETSGHRRQGSICGSRCRGALHGEEGSGEFSLR